MTACARLIRPAAAKNPRRRPQTTDSRALEVFELTGQPILGRYNRSGESGAAPRHPAVWIGLLWEKQALNTRINAPGKNR